MSMKFTRKGFFQSIFGGLFAVAAIPSSLKAEQNNETVNYNGASKLGTGTAYPDNVLHVSSIIFYVNNRRLQMSGDDNGDFKIQWLDVKDDESSASITIQPPKPNPFKVICNDIRYS